MKGSSLICLKYKRISDERHCCTDACSTKMSGRWRGQETLGRSHGTPDFTPALSLPLSKQLFVSWISGETYLFPNNPFSSLYSSVFHRGFQQKWEQDRLSGLKGSMAPRSEATGVSAVLTVTDHRRSRGKEIFNYIWVIRNLQNVSICVHACAHACAHVHAQYWNLPNGEWPMEPMQQTESTRHSAASKITSTHLVSDNPLTWIRQVHKSPSQWTF